MGNTAHLVDADGDGMMVPCQERVDLLDWLETPPVYETAEERAKREDAELLAMIGFGAGDV